MKARQIIVTLCLFLTALCDVAAGQSDVMDQFKGISAGQFPGAAGRSPDLSGAVGRRGILQVVNAAAAYFPKSGGVDRTTVWQVPLAGPGGVFPTAVSAFCPRAIYDEHQTQRFWFTALELNQATQKSWLHLAVSKNADPRGRVDPADGSRRLFDPDDWHRYRLELTRGATGADHATLMTGISQVFITMDFYQMAPAGSSTGFTGGIVESGIYALDRFNILAGAGAAVDGSAPPPGRTDAFFTGITDGSLVPAIKSNVSSETAFGGNYRPTFLSLDQDALDTFIDTVTVTGTTVSAYQTDLDNYLIPGPAPQPGGALPLGTQGDRMHGAADFGFSDSLGVFLSEADNSDQSVIRLAHLRRTESFGVQLVETATVAGGPGTWYSLPTVTTSMFSRCICLSWISSSATQAPKIHILTSIPTTGQPLLNVQHNTVISPGGVYFGSQEPGEDFTRWGRYALSCVDPVDNAFWVCQPYAESAGPDGWGTWWVKVGYDAAPVISRELHVTTPQDPTPQFGTLLSPGEVGEPIRTIKVGQGQHTILGPTLTNSLGQTLSTGTYDIVWYKDGVEQPGLLDQFSLVLTSTQLVHQGRYRFEVRDRAHVLTFGEEIFLDVVVPPAVALNHQRLFLGPGMAGYFEVSLTGPHTAEMDTVTYTWSRPGRWTLPGSTGQAFHLTDPGQAAAYAGDYICEARNLSGAVTVQGQLIAGPVIPQGMAVSGSDAVCGPGLAFSIAGAGVGSVGPPGQTRPDFGSPPAGTLWQNGTDGWSSVVWRKNGIPISMGGRFSVTVQNNPPGQTLQISSPDYEDEGDYDAIVTDLWGPSRAVTLPYYRLRLTPLAPPYVTVKTTGNLTPRQNANMVYDERRRRTVLFGGEAYGLNPRTTFTTPGRYLSNDTWEWDGHGWMKRNPATNPPALTHFSMAYDPARGRTVIFGGYKYEAPGFLPGTQTVSNEVWEWDGKNWMLMPSSTPAPLARLNAALCYDPFRQETLMIGGTNLTPTPPNNLQRDSFNELWAWNGQQWSARPMLPTATAQVSSSTTGPPGFAFDPERGVAVLFGPFFYSQPNAFEYDGTGWTARPSLELLRVANSTLAKAFYDPYRRMIAMPLSYAEQAFATAAETNKVYLCYWNGTHFIKGETGYLNDIDGNVPTVWSNSPNAGEGDLTAFDTHRRCLVFQDNSSSFLPTATVATREMHFTGKARILNLPMAARLDSNDSITLTVITAGLRPMTWQWYRDGVLLDNATSPNLTATLPGKYLVVAGNAHASVPGQEITVTAHATGPAILQGTDNLTLIWNPDQILETSTDLSLWTPVRGAVPPYLTATDEPRRFFRVR